MKLKTLSISLCALFAGLATGPAGAETVIRFSYELPVTHEFHQAAQMMAKDVADGTNGSVKIELYPAGQLTKDSTFPREITSGTIDGGLSPTLYWTGVMPIAGIFDVPYLVRTHAEAQKVLETEVGQTLLDGLDKFGAVGIGYFNYGFGIFGTTNKALLTPDDFRGLKIRSNNDMGASLLKAFGASPTFMSGSEVFLGLQQGTVDGAHVGLTSVLSRKMYEVLKYLTVDNHNMIPYFVIVRKEIYAKLTPEEQAVLRAAVAKAGDWVAGMQESADAKATEELRGHGMQVDVLTDEQVDVWAAAARPVATEWIGRVGAEGEELIESIEKTLGRSSN